VFPAAVYTTDAEGNVTFYNRAAEDLTGRTPQIGVDKWCVAWKLYTPEGQPLPLDQCPMAIALKQGRAVRNVAVVAERPNGERVPLMPFPTPLRDEDGRLIGAVNLLVDISDLKRAEAAVARRADEQAALYRFTDRLYRAQGEEDVFEAALDAILSALRCHRASLLLFDDAGVMQFVASRGLSAAYRAAVTGHTPWKSGESQPEAISVSDVSASDIPDELKTAVSEEGIAALAFVPIVANGGVAGKFMVYFDRPHVFTREEIDLALTLARQIGFTLERRRAEDALQLIEEGRRADRRQTEEARQKLISIIENSDDAIISKDLNGIMVSWNKGAERLYGDTPDEIIGKSVLLLIPPELQYEEPDILDRLRRGERIEHYETVRQRKDGQRIHISLTVSPVKNAEGKVVGASKIARDITERKRADEQRNLLINELNHRVKNTLATVQSLAMQTLRSTERSADARALFDSRLSALSRAHDLLTAENWEGAYLREVVDRAVAAFRTSDRITTSGPVARLSPKAALSLSIALHELATNATKYGALSGPSGRVEISWSLDNGAFMLNWREVDGPPVAPPSRTGFGTRLIERSLAHDLGGEARIEYLREGVQAFIRAPLEGAVER
jgi:PAS domain S-box-containing protein